ncbi:peamaclein-like [Zingiber officinale]|uniref:peamaclein-like n=1 Tax=Zingiber officinale TaxID=94328 RepID=UPI001C4B7542|nr:peamaclein-like [Zingiber officinale]
MATEGTSHSIQSHRHLHKPSAEAMKPIHYALAFLFLLLASSHLQATMADSAFCRSKCKVRCSKASVMDGCLKYCSLCCAQCHCVPSGTYGHKDECPCYRDKTTGIGKRRRPKCP